MTVMDGFSRAVCLLASAMGKSTSARHLQMGRIIDLSLKIENTSDLA
jgi:hypothetical protein